MPVEVASGLVAALLTLGGAWATIKSLRADANGLGRKIGALQDQDVRMLLAQLIVTEKREDREMLVQVFLQR